MSVELHLSDYFIESAFGGTDVAELLGYANASKAVSTHCKHVKKEMIAHSQNGKMVKTQTSLDI